MPCRLIKHQNIKTYRIRYTYVEVEVRSFSKQTTDSYSPFQSSSLHYVLEKVAFTYADFYSRQILVGILIYFEICITEKKPTSVGLHLRLQFE